MAAPPSAATVRALHSCKSFRSPPFAQAGSRARVHSLPFAARNFKLLDELEEAEKSTKSGADISLGLARPDDTFMSDWSASILCAAVRDLVSCDTAARARSPRSI